MQKRDELMYLPREDFIPLMMIVQAEWSLIRNTKTANIWKQRVMELYLKMRRYEINILKHNEETRSRISKAIQPVGGEPVGDNSGI